MSNRSIVRQLLRVTGKVTTRVGQSLEQIASYRPDIENILERFL